MQADEVQNAKEPIAAQIDLSGQTLSLSSSETFLTRAHQRPNWSSALSGLGFRVRDRETSSVVGLCVKSYPNF